MLGSRPSEWSPQGKKVWSITASATGSMKVRPAHRDAENVPAHRVAAAVAAFSF